MPDRADPEGPQAVLRILLKGARLVDAEGRVLASVEKDLTLHARDGGLVAVRPRVAVRALLTLAWCAVWGPPEIFIDLKTGKRAGDPGPPQILPRGQP
jgi:hypothetical protein